MTFLLGAYLTVLAALAAAIVLALAAGDTSTVSLAEPAAGAGELLVIGSGDDAETVVVRRVMPDLTAGHVVLVRPYQRWHRWRWTRRWL